MNAAADFKRYQTPRCDSQGTALVDIAFAESLEGEIGRLKTGIEWAMQAPDEGNIRSRLRMVLNAGKIILMAPK